MWSDFCNTSDWVEGGLWPKNSPQSTFSPIFIFRLFSDASKFVSPKHACRWETQTGPIGRKSQPESLMKNINSTKKEF
jgi:hypothetical protein